MNYIVRIYAIQAESIIEIQAEDEREAREKAIDQARSGQVQFRKPNCQFIVLEFPIVGDLTDEIIKKEDNNESN